MDSSKNKNEVRPAYGFKVLMAFLLATVAFVLIFVLGYSVSYLKYQSVLQAQESIRYNLLSFEVEKELLGENCDNFDPFRFSEEMDDMGMTIGLLEGKIGKTDPRILSEKKTYSLLEARHMLYIEEMKKKCNSSIKIILFFYSNKLSDKGESDALGYMLTSLKNQNPEIMVYSFDFHLDSSLISLLKEKYNVTRPNIIVVNGKTIAENFENIDILKASI